MEKKTKKIKIIVGVCILLAVLIPIPRRYKDGGTVEYCAILYSVSDVHRLTSLEEHEAGHPYEEGIIVRILGIEIFNNVK